MHSRGISLLPFLVFLGIFLGSGVYFHLQEVEFAFYQISPTVAILPAITLAIFLGKGKVAEQIDYFIEGLRNRDIIMMCIIFILAGAFGVVTEAIGCVEDTVQFAISFLPSYALLPGLFLISAFISTAMGTSMGVIATVTPIAVGFANAGNLPILLGVSAVVSGSMFGDNLSMISDTTIASVQSQGADLKKKFILNSKIAIFSAFIMVLVLFVIYQPEGDFIAKEYSFIKVLPYILIVVLAMLGLHVFKVLMIGIICAGFIGLYANDYSIVQFSKDIYKGFASMNEIMVLSLLIGGLSNIIKEQGGINYIVETIEKLILKNNKSKKKAEYVLCSLASVNDIFIANNTIAIILAGEVSKNIATKNGIKPERAACWLDIFSCVFQGVLPYSAQILLASSLSGVQPLEIVSHIYYCMILAIVTIFYIGFSKKDNNE